MLLAERVEFDLPTFCKLVEKWCLVLNSSESKVLFFHGTHTIFYSLNLSFEFILRTVDTMILIFLFLVYLILSVSIISDLVKGIEIGPKAGISIFLSSTILMYGFRPRAMMEKLANVPPEKISKRDNSWLCWKNRDRSSVLIPGTGT